MKTKIRQAKANSFFEYFLLSIILIGGFLIRLYKINNPIADWHSWRQADTSSVTQIYVEKGINILYPKYHDISSIQSGIFNPSGYRMVEFPIYNAVTAVTYKIFPSQSLEIWGRLVTIFFAVTTALFLYLIGKRFLGIAGGILSAFFYLFIPYNIYFTRVILPDPAGVAFGIISIWAFIKFIDKDSDFFLWLSAIFFALMLLIKPYLGFYIFPISYLAIKKYGFRDILKSKKILQKMAVFSLVAITPFLLWRAWGARFPEGIPFFTWAFNGDRIRFHPAFWKWIFGVRLGRMILGISGLIPFVFGILNSGKTNKFTNYFLLGCLFYVTAIASANVRHDYYQILVIPAIALTLASGSIFLWERGVLNKVFSRVLLIFSVVFMLIFGWKQIKDNYQINHPEIIEAGQAVDRLTPKDALVIAPYDGDTAFLYQTKRSGWPAIDDSIDNIIERGADFYVSVNLGSADTKMLEAKYKTVKKTNRYIIIDLHQTLK